MLTDVEQMAQDLANGESRRVEFKSWMDITKGPGQQKIARSISALSNSGGGRLYFGVDDGGIALAPSSEFPLEMFSQEKVHILLRRYVGELECQVRMTDFEGVKYPVVHIPRHGELPWIAPDQFGNAGGIYIRSIKPETVTPSTQEQWAELLESLMQVREQKAVRSLEDGIVARTQEMAGLVAEQLRGLLAAGDSNSAKPDWNSIEALAEATREAFNRQIGKVRAKRMFGKDAYEGDPGEYERDTTFIGNMAKNNTLEGYALLTADDELVMVDELQRKLRAASHTMRQVSYDGWADFLTLSDPSVSPRACFWNIDNRKLTGIEGLRHDQRKVFSHSLDYWRAYSNGVFVTCKSFDEDVPGSDEKPKRYLAASMFILRMHSILAHAGLISRQVPAVKRIAIFSEPIGVEGRKLLSGGQYDRQMIGPGVTSDRYPFRQIISASDLTDHYMATLAGVLNGVMEPFLHEQYQGFMTKSLLEKEFKRLNDRLVTIRPLPPPTSG
ncbi:ATP-binding protein [Agrobacterium tumefaciens]|uniref:AlbA family DNA-binding domain-containing protein n=1 Tax=Agrobacterium TaxID=357 RepID=UPI00115E4D95|nr:MULTISPECIES: ATP-binding protein [Agrobacterium]MDA5243099.1 ATP-binding protein [Agrobacterium sp. MAFF310724]MDA5247349.1 ATP-binding protein [Agrobacterium sp. MAFF210268]TRB16293.1 ATP-binding protein [Agrobacterium tumefaciens]